MAVSWAGKGGYRMKIWRICIGLALTVGVEHLAQAQTPVLSTIQTEYPPLQQSVQVAGTNYSSGQVPYGTVGMPLIISGSNFGTSGQVLFVAYKNCGPAPNPNCSPDPNNPPVVAPISSWSTNAITAAVPLGAKSGLVEIQNDGGTSNKLPFMVMAGTYSAACRVVPVGQPLQILTSSLNNGQVNQAYSLTLQASGGSAPYSWSLASGSLPSGLSLNSSGSITGTPTNASTPANVTIQAVDSSSPQQQNAAVLSIEVDAQPGGNSSGSLYNFSIQNSGGSGGGYDPAGNVTSVTDSVNGAWSFSYDTLNRLATASGSDTSNSYPNLCWEYDSFGNRMQQYSGSAPFSSGNGGPNACNISGTAGSTFWANYGVGTNQITGSSQNLSQNQGYDAAGNINYDGTYSYLYDGDGRLCAVRQQVSGIGYVMTQYLYDAEGNRVAKGSITSWSCDTTSNGFTAKTIFVVGESGEQLSELSWSGSAWQAVHTNVYASGSQVGTYDADLSGQTEGSLYFHLTDWLGTRRQQTDYSGNPCLNFTGLPYGDGLTSVPIAGTNCGDATEHHFTGKERDTETGGSNGNDYFGARYYASSMGRFLSPDWSDDPDPVPYADYETPQSLNLYSYGSNNPLTDTDSDGHYSCDPDTWDPNTNTLTAGACHYDWSDWQQLFQIMNQATHTMSNAVSQATQQVVNYATAPRDPGCMATMMGGMTAAGTGAGTVIGGFGGGVGGTLVEPGGGTFAGGWAGAAAGGASGGWTGAQVGTIAGFFACASGSGGSGGGGGSFKKPKPGITGKEGAKDVPSWAKGQRPRIGESGKEFAKRLLDEEYGPGNYDKGPTSEFNRIQKWGDRAFE